MMARWVAAAYEKAKHTLGGEKMEGQRFPESLFLCECYYSLRSFFLLFSQGLQTEQGE